jgi:hypothetical protein
VGWWAVAVPVSGTNYLPTTIGGVEIIGAIGCLPYATLHFFLLTKLLLWRVCTHVGVISDLVVFITHTNFQMVTIHPTSLSHARVQHVGKLFFLCVLFSEIMRALERCKLLCGTVNQVLVLEFKRLMVIKTTAWQHR